MKIKRTVNNVEMTFELTRQELESAAAEYNNDTEWREAMDSVTYEMNSIGIKDTAVIERAADNYIQYYFEDRMDHEYALTSAIVDACNNNNVSLPETWRKANEMFIV